MQHSTDSSGSLSLVHPSPHPLSSLDPYFPQLAQPSQFNLVVNHLKPYSQHRLQEPDHLLFIDHLLNLALPSSSSSSSAFPPSSHDQLVHLISSLHSGPASVNPNTARSCLYYLALALNPTTANAYADDYLLPAPFRRSVRAFHAFDTANYAKAVKLLADPTVTPDFVPRTFAVLGSLPPADQRAKLVLNFWRFAGINLDDHGKDQVKVVIRALCSQGRSLGVNEAWGLARDWKNEHEREELVRTVLAACFGDNPTSLPLASHLATLLAHPFTVTEDEITTAFCASPPSPLSPNLTTDWRLSKLIAESRPVDALRFWNTAENKKGVEASEQRDRLLAAVEANLTQVQRTTLSLEIAPAPPAQTPAAPSASSSTIMQPAWAPAPAPPPTHAAPPRTLAAARLAHLPPPSAPAPQAADLPLSASSFLRGPSGPQGTGGVLKALGVAAQATPARKPSVSAPFAAAAASPARIDRSTFGFPLASVGVTGPPSTANGGARSSVGQSPVKPTLSGFGSVRQVSQQQQQQSTPKPSSSSSRQVSRRFESEREREQGDAVEDEDEDGDEMMLDDEMAPPPAANTGDGRVDDEQDYDFASRAALDPAIAATIAAANAASPSRNWKSKPAPPPPQSTSKRSRVSNGAGARDRARARGDKRRAVSTEPEGANADGEKRRQELRKEKGQQDRPDQKRTVKLPPGAFPGQEEEDEGHDQVQQEQEEEERDSSQSQRKSQPSTTRTSSRSITGTTSTSTTKKPKTPARRSTRQSTVEPSGSEADEAHAPVPRPRSTSSRSRRSTRAASANGSEGEEKEKEKEREKPKRRSSRLSNVTETETPARGTRRSTRTRGGAIEEEDDQ
ncbi:hypothetical protein JCM11641_004475 [Rhodosporidiobolus odoratus]